MPTDSFFHFVKREKIVFRLTLLFLICAFLFLLFWIFYHFVDKATVVFTILVIPPVLLAVGGFIVIECRRYQEIKFHQKQMQSLLVTAMPLTPEQKEAFFSEKNTYIGLFYPRYEKEKNGLQDKTIFLSELQKKVENQEELSIKDMNHLHHWAFPTLGDYYYQREYGYPPSKKEEKDAFTPHSLYDWIIFRWETHFSDQSFYVIMTIVFMNGLLLGSSIFHYWKDGEIVKSFLYLGLLLLLAFLIYTGVIRSPLIQRQKFHEHFSKYHHHYIEESTVPKDSINFYLPKMKEKRQRLEHQMQHLHETWDVLLQKKSNLENIQGKIEQNESLTDEEIKEINHILFRDYSYFDLVDISSLS